MKGLFLVFALLFPLLSADGEDLCGMARDSFRTAARIRGLEKKREVPCSVENRNQVEKFLLETVAAKYPSGKMDLEGTLFKAIGFIPENFDYQKGLIEFYASQVGGYYDPGRKRFVMAGWMPAILQSTVAVHELTHALQDQYYDLEAFTDVEMYTSDELLARSALIEGDATAVMLDYARETVGKPGIEKERDVDSMMLQNILGFSFVSAGASVPKGLQMLMFFPYTSGLRFVHGLMLDGGYAGMGEAYRSPPRSTEEILHPEKYSSGSPDFIRLDDSEAGCDPEDGACRVEYRDTMGEFFISALLITMGENPRVAAEAAAGWRGDSALITRSPDGRERVHWTIAWDSADDLRQFQTSYRERLGRTRKTGSFSFKVDESALKLRILYLE